MQVRLGHEAMMLNKIGKQTKRVLSLADAVRNGTVGTSQAGVEDDMGVSIGNEIHYHGKQSSGLMPKVALGAALLSGGAAAGVAANYLLNRPADAQRPAVVDTDTDTITELRFGE